MAIAKILDGTSATLKRSPICEIGKIRYDLHSAIAQQVQIADRGEQ